MTDAELDAALERAARGLKGIEYEGGGPSGDAEETCRSDIPALVSALREARRLLRRFEWADEHEGGSRGVCWTCGRYKPGWAEPSGHRPGCALAEAIK